MASNISIFSLLLFLLLPLSLSSPLLIPLTKDPHTHQYLTRIFHGSQPTSLIIDLNSPLSWLHCPPSSSSSNSTKVNCRSIQCTSAAPNPCPATTSSSSSEQQPCSLLLQNPINGVSATGELVEGTITFLDQISSVDSFLLSCAPSILLSGLPVNTNGVFGFGRTRLGAISQISHSFDYPKKFSLCSSSKNGMISFSNENTEVFRSMMYTPILENHEDPSSYFINLKAVKVQNKKLPSLDESSLSSIKISTIDPYSKMETSLYLEFIQTFSTAAESLNLTRVPPKGGFELCYDIKGSTVIPVIDFVLQSEMVKWRVYGHNSMVKVNDEVMCLGFLNGGMKLEGGISIILGSYQLENNLLEFDLVSSMLGFSSSLLKLHTSCSKLSFSAMNHKGLQAF